MSDRVTLAQAEQWTGGVAPPSMDENTALVWHYEHAVLDVSRGMGGDRTYHYGALRREIVLRMSAPGGETRAEG